MNTTRCVRGESPGSARGRGIGARAGAVFVLVVMCVLAVTGAAKLLDLRGFEASLATWKLLPQWSRGPVALLIPAAEVLIGAAWLAGIRRPGVLWAGAGLLAAFTAAYGLHVAMAKPPSCGCLGTLERFRNLQVSATQHLVFNGVLIGSLVGGGAAMGCVPALARPRWPAAATRSYARRGFTLVELIVCVAVIAVLMSLSLPGLARSRGSASAAATLAKMRHHASVFAAYAGDHQDLMPRYTDPYGKSRVGEAPDQVSVGYFGGFRLWQLAMARQYYGESPFSDTFFVPTGDPERRVAFWYAAAFIADPAFWNEYTRRGPSQWRATRVGEVLYPSQKGLLITEREVLRGGRDGEAGLYGLTLSDASARMTTMRSLAAPYPGGEGSWPGSELGPPGYPVMHTRDGVRGRDVR